MYLTYVKIEGNSFDPVEFSNQHASIGGEVGYTKSIINGRVESKPTYWKSDATRSKTGLSEIDLLPMLGKLEPALIELSKNNTISAFAIVVLELAEGDIARGYHLRSEVIAKLAQLRLSFDFDISRTTDS